MVGQYLLPEESISFEQLGEIADWHKGYVVWAYPVWQWMMDKGVKITDFDVIDYEGWANEGVEGLKAAVSEKNFKFYKKNSYDLEETSKQLSLVSTHPNFTYIKKKLSWQDVLEEFKKPGICDVSVDGRFLNRKDGFSLHRIVLIDITKNEVVFHDPTKENDGAYKSESVNFFREAFERIDGPEMARYSLA
jgi:hypothetical protein